MSRLLALFLALLVTAGCSRFAPDAGQEIVLVKKPWFFGHGGIDPQPVTTGATFGAITTDGTFIQNGATPVYNLGR